MTEHVTITDPQIHEPKGVSTATSGEIYVANGLGSGTWQLPDSFDVGTMYLEPLLSASSLAVTQNPAGTDQALKVEYGPAQNNGDVALAADGTITFVTAGTYQIRILHQLGRTGGAGVSRLHLRALVNGSFVGTTRTALLSDSEVSVLFSDSFWITSAAGGTLAFELIRDPADNNSGGLVSGGVTATGWVESPTANLVIQRWATM